MALFWDRCTKCPKWPWHVQDQKYLFTYHTHTNKAKFSLYENLFSSYSQFSESAPNDPKTDWHFQGQSTQVHSTYTQGLNFHPFHSVSIMSQFQALPNSEKSALNDPKMALSCSSEKYTYAFHIHPPIYRPWHKLPLNLMDIFFSNLSCWILWQLPSDFFVSFVVLYFSLSKCKNFKMVLLLQIAFDYSSLWRMFILLIKELDLVNTLFFYFLNIGLCMGTKKFHLNISHKSTRYGLLKFSQFEKFKNTFTKTLLLKGLHFKNSWCTAKCAQIWKSGTLVTHIWWYLWPYL